MLTAYKQDDKNYLKSFLSWLDQEHISCSVLVLWIISNTEESLSCKDKAQTSLFKDPVRTAQ